MKAAVKQLLKLWLFETANHCGSHMEKTTWKDFLILHIFHSNGGFRFSDIFHGNKLDEGVWYAGFLQGNKYILFRQMLAILHNISILYSSIGAFKPSF